MELVVIGVGEVGTLGVIMMELIIDSYRSSLEVSVFLLALGGELSYISKHIHSFDVFSWLLGLAT
jgi:hypothetical protein